jgi:hypothetical protein
MGNGLSPDAYSPAPHAGAAAVARNRTKTMALGARMSSAAPCRSVGRCAPPARSGTRGRGQRAAARSLRATARPRRRRELRLSARPGGRARRPARVDRHFSQAQGPHRVGRPARGSRGGDRSPKPRLSTAAAHSTARFERPSTPRSSPPAIRRSAPERHAGRLAGHGRVPRGRPCAGVERQSNSDGNPRATGAQCIANKGGDSWRLSPTLAGLSGRVWRLISWLRSRHAKGASSS